MWCNTVESPVWKNIVANNGCAELIFYITAMSLSPLANVPSCLKCPFALGLCESESQQGPLHLVDFPHSHSAWFFSLSVIVFVSLSPLFPVSKLLEAETFLILVKFYFWQEFQGWGCVFPLVMYQDAHDFWFCFYWCQDWLRVSLTKMGG